MFELFDNMVYPKHVMVKYNTSNNHPDNLCFFVLIKKIRTNPIEDEQNLKKAQINATTIKNYDRSC